MLSPSTPLQNQMHMNLQFWFDLIIIMMTTTIIAMSSLSSWCWGDCLPLHSLLPLPLILYPTSHIHIYIHPLNSPPTVYGLHIFCVDIFFNSVMSASFAFPLMYMPPVKNSPFHLNQSVVSISNPSELLILSPFPTTRSLLFLFTYLSFIFCFALAQESK